MMDVHTFVKAITNVATRYAPSRVLSFSEVHVFKTLAANERESTSKQSYAMQGTGYLEKVLSRPLSSI